MRRPGIKFMNGTGWGKFFYLALLIVSAGCTGQTVMVYQDNGEKQCEGGGITLSQSTRTLNDAGIEVLESKCGARTGVFVTTVCGAPTNAILIHKVEARHLEKSRELGFAKIDNLVNKSKGTGYEIRQCPDT